MGNRASRGAGRGRFARNRSLGPISTRITVFALDVEPTSHPSAVSMLGAEPISPRPAVSQSTATDTNVGSGQLPNTMPRGNVGSRRAGNTAMAGNTAASVNLGSRRSPALGKKRAHAHAQLKKRSTRRSTACNSWSGLRGSNPRPPPWQGGALPTALSPRDARRNYTRPSKGAQELFFDFL